VLALPPKPLQALAPNLPPDQRHFLEGIKPLPSINLELGLSRWPAISETFILPPRSEQADLTTIVMDHLKALGRAPVGKGVVSLFCRDDWAAAHLHSPDRQIFDSILEMAQPFVGNLRAISSATGSSVGRTRSSRAKSASTPACVPTSVTSTPTIRSNWLATSCPWAWRPPRWLARQRPSTHRPTVVRLPRPHTHRHDAIRHSAG
jgi:hypothetical protein